MCISLVFVVRWFTNMVLNKNLKWSSKRINSSSKQANFFTKTWAGFPVPCSFRSSSSNFGDIHDKVNVLQLFVVFWLMSIYLGKFLVYQTQSKMFEHRIFGKPRFSILKEFFRLIMCLWENDVNNRDIICYEVESCLKRFYLNRTFCLKSIFSTTIFKYYVLIKRILFVYGRTKEAQLHT